MADLDRASRPTLPADVGRVEDAARGVAGLAESLRVLARAQLARLDGSGGWAGEAHDAWARAAEQSVRAAVAVAVSLDRVVAVLACLVAGVHRLRQRAAALRPAAQAAQCLIDPDGALRPVDVPLPATAWTSALAGPASTAAVLGPSIPDLRSAATGQHAVRLAVWRRLQLDIVALIVDAETVYAAAVAGLRGVLAEHDPAWAPPAAGRRRPDGGSVLPAAAAVAGSLVQLPGARDDLRSVLERYADAVIDPRDRQPRGPGRAALFPDTLAEVVRQRRLGRAERLGSAARTLDRLIVAGGQLPVFALADLRAGSLVRLPDDPVLRRIPVLNVLLATASVRHDITSKGYSTGGAVGREAVAAAAGVAATELSGYLAVVVLGGPLGPTAIVSLGVGYLAARGVGWLYDRIAGHDR